MEIKELQSWDDFDGVLDEIVQFREKYKRVNKDAASFPTKLLFRGQADAGWTLATTLERTLGQNYELYDYYRLLLKVKTRIETFTDQSWEEIDLNKVEDWLSGTDFMAFFNLPAYKYIVYLRHHEFPSPLLDWTASPYIAAYFAFREILSKAVSVAIFVYLEDFGTRGGVPNRPYINRLGSNVRSDERHFLQQSEYTICTKGEGVEACFCSHEEAFTNKVPGVNDTGQDMLWKIVIPSSERQKAIRKLELYSINAYSLFRSEESLMETVFLRELFKGFGI